MLRLLRIRNLAVIEAVEVELESGFNVLTGETGRREVDPRRGRRSPARRPRIGRSGPYGRGTGHHRGDLRGPRVPESALFAERSRVRAAAGPSSMARSQRPARFASLSDRLVELHGQHEHQSLLDPLSHLPLVDESGGLVPLLEPMASAWASMRALREQRDRARMDGREKAARLDLIAFQLGEIEKAALRPGEDEELATSKRVLANAERIQRLCEESYAAFTRAIRPSFPGCHRSGSAWRSWPTIEPQFAEQLDAREESNRSSRTWPSCCVVMRTKSTRPQRGFSRLRIDLR